MSPPWFSRAWMAACALLAALTAWYGLTMARNVVPHGAAQVRQEQPLYRLNQREVAELRRGLEARRKNIARRKPSDKPGEASSTAMEATSIRELDTKLAVAIANDLQKENGQ